MIAAPLFASRSGCDWQTSRRAFARSHAESTVAVRARLYKEVQF